MLAEKPHIVLIPGAWHPPNYYDDLVSQLLSHGHQCHALHLPSAGKIPTATAADDAQYIQETTRRLAEQGREIVLVMHSYAGVPGTESARGLVKKDRQAEGKQGGIIGLVYLAALLLPENTTATQTMSGPFDDFIVHEGDVLKVSNSKDARRAFYNDLPEAVAEKYMAKLLPQSVAVFNFSLSYLAYRHVPTTYVVCKQDRALPMTAQQNLIAATGVNITTCVLDSGHSPMLSMPERTANIVRKVAGEAE